MTRLMKFGLTEAQYQFILENVVQPFLKRGAKIYCYGSRARGDQQPFSDLDLMIESSADLSKEVGQLNEFMSNSNFPYKVELVEFSQFADSYKQKYLKERKEFVV